MGRAGAVVESTNVINHYYHRAIISVFLAGFALFGLFSVLAAPDPEPAAAQEEPPYYVVRNSTNSVPTCLEATEPYEYDESNCYDLEIPAWQLEGTNDAINVYDNLLFCGLEPNHETYVRMYLDMSINGYFPHGTAFVRDSLFGTGLGFYDDSLFEYGQCSQWTPPGTYYEGYVYANASGTMLARLHENAMVRPACSIATGYAHMTVCIEDSTPPEEPPEPPDLCPDGIEALSSTVLIPASGTWTDTVETAWDKIWVRYAFTEPNTSGILHRLVMEINDESITRQFYSDEVMVWDPELGYINDPWYYSVPNRDDPTESDYDPTGYVSGTTANLSVASGYNPINLVSACVIPHLGPSELCPDGIEALSGGPEYLNPLNGYWETTIPITSTHIVVRYSVENPMGYGSGMLGDPFQFMPRINYTYYYVEGEMAAGESLTFTLPTTDVIRMFGEEQLSLAFNNLYWPVILNSVCVVDALDAGYIEQLDEETCHLENPDFIGDIDGWSTQGTATWNADGNGAAELETGEVFQAVGIERSSVWGLQVRAKDIGGTTMDFGAFRTALIDGGPQTDTVELSSFYGLHTNDIYIKPGDAIFVESDGALIDSVCLVEPSTLLGDFDCTLPEWDPEGSGDSLIIYVFSWLGDVLKWVVCEILRGIAILFDKIYQFIQNIVLRIPMLPEPGSGLYSWVEWFALLIGNILDWFGFNIPEIAEWFPRNFDEFARWLAYLLRGFVFWLAEALGLDPWVVWDVIRLVWNEARLFWEEILIEIDIETDNAILLLQNTANVFITLANGVRSGVSGDEIAYIGEDFSGIGGFIWTGVDFVNEAVDMTPISGLNIIALGVIAWGLLVWTGKKFVKIIESVGA